MNWHSFLGTPYRAGGREVGPMGGLDCATLAEEYLKSQGGSPPATQPFRISESLGEQNEMGTYFSYLEDSYDCLGDEVKRARLRGDLVLAADEDGVARFLYVCVDPHRGLFLTATHNQGVIAIKGFAIRRVIGVYRLRGASL